MTDIPPMPQDAPPAPPPDRYAIVEIFGHRRLVGRVMEIERYGTKMLRIDIPKDGDFALGYTTQFYGGASIFCETPTDLETVRQANAPIDRPVGLLTRRDLGDGSLRENDLPF